MVGVKPILTVKSVSANKISNSVGCTFVFVCDTDLQAFQCRGTLGSYGVGVGDLIYSADDIKANTDITVTINASQLTFGDGEYRISLWGKADDIPFDFDDIDFNNINFNGDLGEWNT